MQQYLLLPQMLLERVGAGDITTTSWHECGATVEAVACAGGCPPSEIGVHFKEWGGTGSLHMFSRLPLRAL
jgi:hypothetical protein